MSDTHDQDVRQGQFVRDIATQVVTALIVSSIGGGFGVYVGYRLLEERQGVSERAITDLRAADKEFSDRLDRYRDDNRSAVQELRIDLAKFQARMEVLVTSPRTN